LKVQTYYFTLIYIDSPDFVLSALKLVQIIFVGVSKFPQESKMIEEACKVKPEVWFSIAKWARENNRFTPFDRKLAYNLGVLANRKAVITVKQAKNGLRILKQAKEEGF